MSLDFDLTAVDSEKYPFIITDEERQLGHQNPITESIIWMSLVTGSPARQKPEEFVKRAMIWDKVAGPMIHEWDEETQTRTPHYLTAEELFDHAGVATNCTVPTPAEFRKRVYQTLEQDVSYSIKRYQREQEKVEA